MEIVTRSSQGVLYIALNGEIDEHSAADARRKADEIIDEHTQATKAVFELQQVSFMDSTGIGFLIGRYKRLRRYGVPMYIAEPNLNADKILSLSGIYALIPKI
jgi:stage II sporulation protein AA (anti-sigma F factor antagonist)